MIVCNGMPKSGTHALMRIIASSGMERIPGLVDGLRGKTILRPTRAFRDAPSLSEAKDMNGFVHGHVPASRAKDLAGCLVINIVRNPRDVAVSFSRWKKVSLEQSIKGFFGRTLVDWYKEFQGWDKHGIIVRYENINEFARTLPGGLYEKADVDNDTWTGSPSNWADWWTDEAEELWIKTGGLELESNIGAKKIRRSLSA